MLNQEIKYSQRKLGLARYGKSYNHLGKEARKGSKERGSAVKVTGSQGSTLLVLGKESGAL